MSDITRNPEDPMARMVWNRPGRIPVPEGVSGGPGPFTSFNPAHLASVWGHRVSANSAGLSPEATPEALMQHTGNSRGNGAY